ncbi:LysE family translocator [Paraburkholderia terricola]|uniref:Threonine/homoserine/homoserine lactone efflux protein n=1 Tax=Paraburkholderia terricola TaxID=169427 RepID=A0ABU1M2F2_9BURK|nr:LysE family translocator [Paraburkholderia terricola]MDR6413204.1 threonine/homoserine/homoserine lactone efflux protein [Paraburkholderia terricola]MDR6484859.1 threonine/homoserine/homoserine lactone efflux protein [Paraburkholderia terricola]
MLFSTWLVYAFVALLSIASPGPAILLAVSNSVRYGMRTVVISSLGNIIGLFFLSALAMAGVGALLKASASMFFILKLCGATYLFYLGIKQWRSRKSIFTELDRAEKKAGLNRIQIFYQACLLALTNPKAILFFSALFPQFLSPGRGLLLQFMILTFTFMAISFCSLMTYGLFARYVRKWMAIRQRHVWFNKFFGTVFMFFGVGMLAMRITAR